MADGEQIPVRKETQKSNKGSHMTKLFAVVAVLAIMAAGYFFVQYQNERSDSPEVTAQRNQELSDEVVTSLSEVLFIGEEEPPTVATIDDADSLRESSNDFYENAQDGDFLILYPQRAIIYRQEANQVINVAPIINAGDVTQP